MGTKEAKIEEVIDLIA
jgi:hypothetical protein